MIVGRNLVLKYFYRKRIEVDMDFGFLVGCLCVAYIVICFTGKWIEQEGVATCYQEEPDDDNDPALTYWMLEEMEG